MNQHQHCPSWGLIGRLQSLNRPLRLQPLLAPLALWVVIQAFEHHGEAVPPALGWVEYSGVGSRLGHPPIPLPGDKDSALAYGATASFPVPPSSRQPLTRLPRPSVLGLSPSPPRHSGWRAACEGRQYGGRTFSCLS